MIIDYATVPYTRMTCMIGVQNETANNWLSAVYGAPGVSEAVIGFELWVVLASCCSLFCCHPSTHNTAAAAAAAAAVAVAD